MGDFSKDLRKTSKNIGNKKLNSPGRALEIAANTVTAAAGSKIPKLVAATAPDIKKFVDQRKASYLCKTHSIDSSHFRHKETISKIKLEVF